MSLKPEISKKREQLCQEYLKCGNQAEAFRKVYKCDTWSQRNIVSKASTIFSDPRMKKRLAELRGKIEKKNILSSQQLQEELSRYILDEKEEECIVVEGVGEGCSQARTMSKKVQPKDKLKAIELLCKLAGYNVEKSAVNVPVAINFIRHYD